MKVLKFGGTSVGSAERMKNVANYVEQYRPQNFLANLEEMVYNGSVDINNWVYDELYSKLNNHYFI